MGRKRTTKTANSPSQRKNARGQDVVQNQQSSTGPHTGELLPTEGPVIAVKESPTAKSGLLVEPTPSWYTIMPPLSLTPERLPELNPQQIASLCSHSEALHSKDIALYASSTKSATLTGSSSDAAFLQRVLTSGTLSDRLSALTLVAQSSPIHNTKALENLKNMSQKKGREESLKALRAIVDWWVGGGAPGRKLKFFRDQPLNHPKVTDQQLLIWYFEDWLKKYFFGVLQILEPLSLDPLPYVRIQAMSLIATLLREKPEQEHNLLRLLVNKLGDAERQVASRASYQLLLLLQSHPQMKTVIVREITSLVLRPLRPTSSTPLVSTRDEKSTRIRFLDDEKTEKKDVRHGHSRYYATITFNQIMLSPTPSDREVAVQLIDVYFEIFKEILREDHLPPQASAPGRDADPGDSGTAGVAKRRVSRDPKGAKGKVKESRGEGGFAEVEDSNSRLVSAILTGVNRALPFSNLDLGNVSFGRHIDTLFLITHTSNFNVSLQALRLILQICVSLNKSAALSTPALNQSNPIVSRYYRTLYSSMQDPRLADSSKQAMYLNLLFKSVKMDKNLDRVKAFVRRFVQLLLCGASGGAEFVVGGLYLLGELFGSDPGLRNMLESTPSKLKGAVLDSQCKTESYDPRKRDPQFANASSTPLWELSPLLYHYHPTVRLHTSQLLSAKPVTAHADLSLNTLSHFLDRFVYKNPKKPKPRGTSAMQPAAAITDGTGVRLLKGNYADGPETVNTEAFWKRKANDVPVDQIFFHKYFSQKNDRGRAKVDKISKRKNVTAEFDAERSAAADETEDHANISDEEGNDSAEEAEIWTAMKASLPGVDNDESSVDLSDSIAGSDQHDEDESSSTGDLENDDASSDGYVSLAEGSDEDDLLPLDAEMPTGLIDYDGSDDEEEWAGIDGNSKKRKHKGVSDKWGKKRLRLLPMFATYEDYAKLIENEPEDNV